MSNRQCSELADPAPTKDSALLLIVINVTHKMNFHKKNIPIMLMHRVNYWVDPSVNTRRFSCTIAGMSVCQVRVVNGRYPSFWFVTTRSVIPCAKIDYSGATSMFQLYNIRVFTTFLVYNKYMSNVRISSSLLLEQFPTIVQKAKCGLSTLATDDVFVKLKEELSSIGIKPVALATEEKFPTNESYDIIVPYSKFIMRVSHLAELIQVLNAKYGIDTDEDRSVEYQKELLSAITAAKLDLRSISSTIELLSHIREVRISDKLVYSFSDTKTVISHERSLFLLNLVFDKFRGTKISKEITSLDQLKAFIRTDQEISDFYSDMKCMFDFAMSLDPVMFDAGVTPEEFKEFISNKRLMSKLNVYTQQVHKELARISKKAKTSVIDANASVFVATNWVYKFSRLTRDMLPSDLNSRIILNNPRVDTMELAYNFTVRSLKTYCIYFFKNAEVDVTRVLTAKQIESLYGFRFDADSFKSYQELLLQWGDRKSNHGVKH